MDTKVNYTIVGVFVIVLVAVMVAIILWLTSLKNDETYNTFVTNMREEVSGLSVQSPVRYNGVKVGYVESLKLNELDPQQVRIILKIQQGTPVSTSTIATLMSEGLTGIGYIGLKALTANAPILRAKPGQVYPVIPSEPSLLMKLSTAVQTVTTSIGQLSHDVSKVFDDENRTALRRSLSNIEQITHSVAINSSEINHTLKNLNVLVKNGTNASDKLPHIMQQITSTLDSLNSGAHSIKSASQGVSDAMNQMQSGLQGVSQQIIPNANSLLVRLNVVANNLTSVSQEMKQNPSVLIRGKAPAKLGPGEK